MTECSPLGFEFQTLGGRQVLAAFDGGKVTSDAGGLLLREIDGRFGFLGRFAGCFTDHRDPDLIEHPLVDLLRQRVFGLCLGYEDLNDHDQLRHDPLLAVLVGKADPLGRRRVRAADRGKALAGKSTLNRLELTRVRAGAGNAAASLAPASPPSARPMLRWDSARSTEVRARGLANPESRSQNIRCWQRAFEQTNFPAERVRCSGHARQGRSRSCRR